MLCNAVQNIDTASMNAGEQPVIGMQDVFQAPGRYVMHVPCPKSRATAVIRIEMRDVNGVVRRFLASPTQRSHLTIQLLFLFA